MVDPVSDLICSIKNALLRKKEDVDCSHSNFKESVVRVLVREGYLSKYEALTRGKKRILRITLKYAPDKYGKPGEPAIRMIRQISKPGRKIYSQAAKISKVQSGFGTSIISTPLGILSGDDAFKKKVGGEILVNVF